MTVRRAGRTGRTEGEQFRGLLGRLTARDRWLLAMLAEHTVLTTSQLLRLGWARGRRATQRRTRALCRAGLLDRFRPLLPRGQGTAPWHLVLGPHGAAALAAETGHTVAEIGYRGRARALAVAHRMTLAHDVATHDLITDLAAARAQHGIELHQWWSAARCRRCFGHHVRPDAYLSLTTPPPTTPGPGLAPGGDGGGWWEMFLEYDTGTEALPRLAAKLAGYHELAAATGIITPVGIWTARPGREPAARRALTDALRALPHPDLVPVLTAASHPASEPADPRPTAAGRVWFPVPPPGRAAQRVSLATLAARHPVPIPRPVGADGADTADGAIGVDPSGVARTTNSSEASMRPTVSRDTSVLAAPHPIPPRGEDLG